MRTLKFADVATFTDAEWLIFIYENRGYVSEEMFYLLEKHIHKFENVNARYEPSPERDPDVLAYEIKHLKGMVTGMQTQLGKMFKEIKDKR